MSLFEYFILSIIILIPFFWKCFFNYKVMWVYFGSIFLHFIIIYFGLKNHSIYYFYDDAFSIYKRSGFYYENGLNFSHLGINVYESFLAILYIIQGKQTWLVACLFSVLIYNLTVVFLLKLLKILNHPVKDWLFISIFSFLPSNLLITSSILRESLMTFSMVFSIYLFIRYIQEEKKMLFFFSGVSFLALSVMHIAHTLYSFFFIFTNTLFSLLSPSKKKYYIFIYVITFMVLSFLFLVNSKTAGIRNWTDFLGNGFLSNVVEYRKNHVTTRATYDTIENYKISNKNYIGVNIFILTFNYFFKPFPADVDNVSDLYAFFESVMRIFFITFSFFSFCKKKKEYFYMTIIYFSINFIWALSTSNYGTALRHHGVSYFLLFIIGLNGLKNFLEKYFPKSKINLILFKEVTSA